MGKARLRAMLEQEGLRRDHVIAAMPHPLHPGGRRQRVPSRVRGCLRDGGHPPPTAGGRPRPCRRAGPSGDGCPPLGRDVERANRSARIEFRSRHDGPLTVAAVAPQLAEHEFLHNPPHRALECLTPNEHPVQLEKQAETERQNSEML